MNRLIHAEWYRVRKTYGLFKWIFIFISLIALATLLDADLTKTDSLTLLATYIGNQSIASVMLAFLLCGCFALSYENKLLYYDVMAGNKISHIILSKCIPFVPIIVLFELLIGAALSGLAGMTNGFGDLDKWLSYLGVFTCINFRVVMSVVLIMTAFKSILGLSIVFIRFAVLDVTFIMIIAPFTTSPAGEKIAGLVTMTQYMALNGRSAVSASFAGRVIATMMIEIGLWYVISYISHKKKLFY